MVILNLTCIFHSSFWVRWWLCLHFSRYLITVLHSLKKLFQEQQINGRALGGEKISLRGKRSVYM